MKGPKWVRRGAVVAVALVALGSGLLGIDTAAAATPQRSSAVARVAVGRYHACTVRANGSVRCWGADDDGQLGNGLDPASSVPVVVKQLSGAVAVSSGAFHSCALLATGGVKCWGRNTDGQLGNNSRARSRSPVPVAGITDAIAISTGAVHSCAVLAGGQVRCWGRNADGQLGNSSTTGSLIPVTVTGLSGVVALNSSAPAAYHSCAVLVTGGVRCWGRNSGAQLGDGSVTSSSTPVTVSGLTGATAASAGGSHSCAVIDTGSVRCWGLNPFGQLGDDTTVNHPTPVAVVGLAGVTAVTAGAHHSCALRAAGDVRCWGRNGDGRLGTGTTAGSLKPATVSGIGGIIGIASGPYSSCSARAGGLAFCSGLNNFGQLGNGTSTRSLVPVAVSGLSNPVGVVAMSAGTDHACAVIANGTLKCWGSNWKQQLGVPTIQGYTPAVRIPGVTGVTAIAAGWQFQCARMAAGTVSCWGSNTYGQLGRGVSTRDPKNTPVAIPGLTGVTAVAAGFEHACALLASGTVKCWGRSQLGQVGNNSLAKSPTPVTVPNLAGVTDIDTSWNHTCAGLSSGAVKCWGDNEFRQIGDGTTAVRALTPLPVGGITDAVTVATGESHSCAQLAGGTVKCWGRQTVGELGGGTTSPTPSATPVNVVALDAAAAIDAGSGFTCAVRADGREMCWGYNASGQLGRGTRETTEPTPALVQNLGAATAHSGGAGFSCALVGSGAMKCWGANFGLAIGSQFGVDSSLPLWVPGLIVDLPPGPL